jgi:hypothetical protein
MLTKWIGLARNGEGECPDGAAMIAALAALA